MSNGSSETDVRWHPASDSRFPRSEKNELPDSFGRFMGDQDNEPPPKSCASTFYTGIIDPSTVHTGGTHPSSRTILQPGLPVRVEDGRIPGAGLRRRRSNPANFPSRKRL